MASAPVISAALSTAGNVQIAVGAPRRTDADVFVGEADVQRILVGLRIDGDGLDAELAAGADDAQGDFAAISDEDFLEHESTSTPLRRF